MKKPFIGRVCAVLFCLTTGTVAFNVSSPLTVLAAEDMEDMTVPKEDDEEKEAAVSEETVREQRAEDLAASDDFETGAFTETEISDSAETQVIEKETEAESKKEVELVALKEEVESKTASETENESETELEISDEAGHKGNAFRYEEGQRTDNKETLFYSESGNFEREWTWDGMGWLNSVGEYIPGAVQKGIDVSYAQGIIDWETVKNTDVSWAIIRCGYGDDLPDQDDTMWERNATACETYGIPYGTYIYSYATTLEEARSEAAHVLRLVKGKNLSMPIYYDLEDEPTTGKCTNDQITQIAKTFCDIIESCGYEVGIYANKYWFTDRLTDAYFDSRAKWIAQYNSECTYSGSYAIWQCTGVGYVDGINHAVDINFSYYDVKGGSSPTIPDPKPEPEPQPQPEDKVASFVQRLYDVVLGRRPEAKGLTYWTNKLKNGEITGAATAAQFFNSNEYLRKNTTDDTYLKNMYRTFFDRNPDEKGKNYWTKQMESGRGRNYVLKGFAESNEFTRLCGKYNIIRGTITLSSVSPETTNIQNYIKRNYSQFLGRTPEASGLQYWTNKLLSGNVTAAQVAKGLIFSNEFTKKNYTNEQFILKLYLGLFGRDADAKGFTAWRKKMNSGMTREEVFEGFVVSNEFKSMIAQFGL